MIDKEIIAQLTRERDALEKKISIDLVPTNNLLTAIVEKLGEDKAALEAEVKRLREALDYTRKIALADGWSTTSDSHMMAIVQMDAALSHAGNGEGK